MDAPPNATGGFPYARWAKYAFLAALLLGAAYLLGLQCRQIAARYQIIFQAPGDILPLAFSITMATLLVLLAVSIAAALVRPIGLALLFVAGSCAALLAGWEFSSTPAILSAVYLLFAGFYLRAVTRELEARLDFSVASLCRGHTTLLLALGFLLSGSLYTALAGHIEREGLHIPAQVRADVLDMVESQFEAREAPPGGRAEDKETQLAQVRSELNRQMDELEQRLEPLKPYAPAIGAFFMLEFLYVVFFLLGLLKIPALLLWAILKLLRQSGFIREVVRTATVRRVVIA